MSFKKVYTWFIERTSPLFNGSQQYYYWGNENSYPNKIKDLIENSPTAQDSWDLNSKYIAGLGFPNDFLINTSTNKTLNDLVVEASRDVSYIKCFAIHVNYSLDLKPIKPSIIPIEEVRKGFKDDNGEIVKIKVCKDWALKNGSSYFGNKKSWRRGISGTDNNIYDYFSYNPDPIVVEAQIRKVSGLKDSDAITQSAMAEFTGQILFASLDDLNIYPISQLNSRVPSMEIEINNELFRNANSEAGYASKNIIVKKPEKANDNYEIDEFGNEIPSDDLGYDEAFEEEKKVINDFLTKQPSNTALIMETDLPDDKLDDAIKVIEIKPTVDVKQMEYADIKSEKNIRNAFDNIPDQLVDSANAGLFGANEGVLKQMRDFYNDQTMYKRFFLQNTFNTLLTDMELENQEITPLYQLKEDDTTDNEGGAAGTETDN